LKPRSLRRPGLVLLAAILAIPGFAACSNAGLPSDPGSPSALPTAMASPVVSPTSYLTMSLPTPDVLITPAQTGQVIPVLIDQIVGIANPGEGTEWQVSYASEVLEILTPPENVHAPGPQGWLFRASAPGRTDVLLTSVPQPCSNNTPCPPVAASFVFTIEVK